jgi:superfamily I DNA/RNA helicase
MATINPKTERSADLQRIKDSPHPKKVVVAGPGTGKSYLFGELIKKKRSEGKTNFLAITFIGKLGDALADDLCGMARTTTMHSFARSFVLEQAKGWNYYPRMRELIAEDLKADGVEDSEIGDKDYIRKTKYYQAVGDDDVVHYAVRICRKDPAKIPIFDLILIDEYQDFNAIESEFVDLLAQKNEIVIVGDDDQALYAFKGSSPAFIRLKYDSSNTEWESFTLRFCSRCTEVIIKAFHSLVTAFGLTNPTEVDPAKKRINKEFICYMPEGEPDSKHRDSKANPNIHLITNCPVGMIAYKIRDELKTVIDTQKIKDVLIIGEGRSCEALLKTIAQQLKNYGFRNVDHRGNSGIISVHQKFVDAYKFLAKDESSVLGWRILGNPADPKQKAAHLSNAETLNTIITGTPSTLDKLKCTDISLLEEEIEDWNSLSVPKAVTNDDLRAGETADRRAQDRDVRKRVLIQELKRGNLHLPRPLCNLEITVCNILSSKGLGADVVFLIGFDQGKFPSKQDPTGSEIYQMLVAMTRAKKRIYLINTISKKISTFIDGLDKTTVVVDNVETKSSKRPS